MLKKLKIAIADTIVKLRLEIYFYFDNLSIIYNIDQIIKKSC